jgi:CBS domain-containing protein
MTAGELMVHETKSIEPGARALDALSMMRQSGIRHLLVVEAGRLVGVLSTRDFRKILEWARPDGQVPNVSVTSVAELMTPRERLVTGTPETPLVEVARHLADRKIGCLPILDASGRPVGILTTTDVIRALARLAGF